MNCARCGKETLSGAQFCRSCTSELKQVFLAPKNPDIRTSWLAILSLILGILSLFTCGITAIPAIVLGIISLIRIEKGGGKLTGTALAKIGLAIPVIVFCIVQPLLLAFVTVRHKYFRMVCQANLGGIGTSMLIYVNDWDDKFPRAGGLSTVWGTTANWQADNKASAFGIQPDGSGGQASISASLYTMHKNYFVSGFASFVCKGDRGVTPFAPAEYGVSNKTYLDLWDFGPNPAKHCSYSYHIPYGPYPLTTSSEPGMAVASDRNPWIPSPFARAKKDFSEFDPNGTKDQIKYGSDIAHRENGQNVLFLDRHVTFEKRPFCGINGDNIYTYWDGPDIRRGTPPVFGSQPKDKLDSLLVNDPPVTDKK
jgi:hypothetical protein